MYLSEEKKPRGFRCETPGGTSRNPRRFTAKPQGFLGVSRTRAHNARTRIRAMRAIARVRSRVYARERARLYLLLGYRFDVGMFPYGYYWR